VLMVMGKVEMILINSGGYINMLNRLS